MKRFLIVVDMQKDFVDGALGTAEAQAIVPAVAEKIRGYIDHEDKTQPLSDEKISQMLRADGLDIARRTVAKYRLKLDIPGTAARRRV